MTELRFKPFLSEQPKPERFEEFRKITSELIQNYEGKIEFTYIENLQQFEITDNTTSLSEKDIYKLLEEHKNYLV